MALKCGTLNHSETSHNNISIVYLSFFYVSVFSPSGWRGEKEIKRSRGLVCTRIKLLYPGFLLVSLIFLFLSLFNFLLRASLNYQLLLNFKDTQLSLSHTQSAKNNSNIIIHHYKNYFFLDVKTTLKFLLFCKII